MVFMGEIIFWRKTSVDDLTILSWYGIESMSFKCWIQHWKRFWKPYENHVKKCQ